MLWVNAQHAPPYRTNLPIARFTYRKYRPYLTAYNIIHLRYNPQHVCSHGGVTLTAWRIWVCCLWAVRSRTRSPYRRPCTGCLDILFPFIKDNPNGYTIDPKDFELEDSIITLHGGKGKGKLIGGNLSLINTLMGTPYEIETKGRILFIEDVGEAPYRIDRYFSQLKMAGKFDHLEGVIIGKLTRRPTEPSDDENSFTMMEVLEQYFSKLGVPVLANFPIGHYKHNISLPIGIMAEIDADKQLIHILVNPTQ